MPGAKSKELINAKYKLLAASAPKTSTSQDIHLEAPYECSSCMYIILVHFNTNSAGNENWSKLRAK